MKTLSFFLLSLVVHQIHPSRFKTLDETVYQELRQKSIAGSTVAVIQGDSLLFWGAYGYANHEAKKPMTPDMLFRLGSTTKMFVATAALMLVDQGKLDLHRPIQTYVPGLSPKLGNITMHQLLSHTAGLF